MVTKDDLTQYLGAVKYQGDDGVVHGEVGAVNGLAWTSVGGVTMPIEVKLLPYGSGKIHLTGSLGRRNERICGNRVIFDKSKAKD